MSAMTTRAPAAVSCSARQRPMPDAPPVTMATASLNAFVGMENFAQCNVDLASIDGRTNRAELDRFCDAMIAVHSEIQRIEKGEWDKANNPLKNAPHTWGNETPLQRFERILARDRFRP